MTVNAAALDNVAFVTKFQNAWEKLTNNGVNADNEPWFDDIIMGTASMFK